jgi:hypothetical protein
VPVAEAGTLRSLDDAERFEVSGAVVYVDRDVSRTGDTWVIDTDGFARWRRLVVLGLALAPVTDVPGPDPGDAPA